MRTTLTADEVAFFKEHGFLAIPDFLTPGEIDELESAVLEALVERNHGRTPEASPYSNLVHHMNPFQTHPRIRKFSTDVRLAELVADLGGLDRVRLYQDMIAVKHPWGGPTGFHMDVPRISFTADHAISWWFPLVDVDLQNGCLYYLPGVHKQRKAACTGVYAADELARIDPSWTQIEPVPVPLSRGGALIHDGYAPHGTNGNMSPRARPVFVITHMPDGCVFDGTPNLVQPGEMPIGAPLNDESRFPLVCSR